MKNHLDIFVNGVFDCFHAGHLDLLQRAHEFASGLILHNVENDKNIQQGNVIVGVDSDEKVRKDKGPARPYFTQEERANQIIDTACVDYVFIFDSDEELYQKIKEYEPRYLLKSPEWKGNVVGEGLVKDVIYYEHMINISTTEIEKRILSKHKCVHDLVDEFLKE